MKETILRWINAFIYDPDLSEAELLQKRNTIVWTMVTLIGVIVMTTLAFMIGALIIGYYGIALLMTIYPIAFFGLKGSKDHLFYTFCGNIITIIITTVFILIFGGFIYSCGLVFVGLNLIYSTVPSNNLKQLAWLAGLYFLSIVIIVAASPFLTLHPDITPRVNLLFWVINMLWMSLVQISFITNYIRERGRIDALEVRRVQELEEAKSKLYTNITHEFRTPLTLILGMADQIDHRDTPTVNALQMIKKHGEKLLRLVNQMLSLSKLESGALKLHPVQGDIIPYLKSVVHVFQSMAAARAIDLSFSSDVPQCIMDYDPEKLEDVISNLISNAVKHTPEGGTIRIHIAQEANPDGNTHAVQESLSIHVTDSGPGIPEEQMPRIFDRFYQVEQSMGHQEGTGVGLTLVREYVKRMNGRVDVHNNPDRGATFTVTLPCTHKAPLQETKGFPDIPSGISPATDMPKTNGRGTTLLHRALPRLLIVEDNPDVITFISSILSSAYDILTAYDGEEGLRVSLEEIPDIIISDVMMPVMDGFSFLKKLKSDSRTSHIPVIMLTAKADVPSRLEGLEYGAEAYLTKPFKKEELEIRLRKLLEMRRILQKRYASYQEKWEADPALSREDAFIRKVRESMDAHLDDEDFGIRELCRELAMSKTQLYRKFSALTDTTVSKYMRAYRLHKARYLLEHSDMNVTQAMMEVGFSSPQYFSRIFKEEFGVSPSKLTRRD